MKKMSTVHTRQGSVLNYMTEIIILFKGIAQHELLHALGMDHEQSRTDRNEFVTIFFDRIEEG